MPTREDFQIKLNELLTAIQELGLSFTDLKAGDLHRITGSYPGPNHRMPVCCNVMYGTMKREHGDKVIEKPPKGRGASLIIRYKLPR